MYIYCNQLLVYAFKKNKSLCVKKKKNQNFMKVNKYDDIMTFTPKSNI
jgi:hypothetical protein